MKSLKNMKIEVSNKIMKFELIQKIFFDFFRIKFFELKIKKMIFVFENFKFLFFFVAINFFIFLGFSKKNNKVLFFLFF